MLASSLKREIVETETFIVGRNKVKNSNTYRGFNSSSNWARSIVHVFHISSIVLLLHFGINQVKTKQKLE